MTAQNPAEITSYKVLDMDTIGWSTGRFTPDEVREYEFAATHCVRSRVFILVDGYWNPACQRCGGSGNYGLGPDNGICYLCNGHGVHGEAFADGEEFQGKLERLAKSTLSESAKNRRLMEKRKAEIAEWRAANPELIAWVEGLAPSDWEAVDTYVQIEADRETAITPRHQDDRLQSDKPLDDGRHWAHFTIEQPVWGGYSSKVQDMLRSVYYGSDLEHRSTRYLTVVMESAKADADKGENTRHAGKPGERLAISGKVVACTDREEGYRFVKVEGQGADEGITWITNTSSESAYSIEAGLLVTVKATIKRNEVYRGVKSDRVGRAVFTEIDALPAAPVTEPAPTPAKKTPAKAVSVAVATPKTRRGTGRREALGASSVDGWELLYDKPKAKAEVVRRDSSYALVCKTHKTLHPLARLTDEGKVRKAGGWCTECH